MDVYFIANIDEPDEEQILSTTTKKVKIPRIEEKVIINNIEYYVESVSYCIDETMKTEVKVGLIEKF